MSVGIEALFTSALGLQAPWVVEDVKLDTAKRRIDFEVGCQGAKFVCPQCGASGQKAHDRMPRSWRHLDFFQFEAWLHADVPRIDCQACGKTTQMNVPWAREGSGFTLLFEALALSMCQGLPVRQAARHLEKEPSLVAAAKWIAGEKLEHEQFHPQVQRALDHAVKPLTRYRCAACGFEAKQHFWQCPGCQAWDSYPPRRVEEL